MTSFENEEICISKSLRHLGLVQWFSATAILSSHTIPGPKGYLAMSGNILGCHKRAGRECYW